ncbi:hypothetical protein C7H85_13740 [Zobellella endophytica]|uniref:Uncharacterized protein n=1 Tax=Zobellella endophytica TaxID=2116700 RepID=A0A2P7R2F1_9GAMM|nr:hypothetical protein [Zobellella endophytica]PSJ44382.1 hypothetical protein C7H85_13740 [Zobellella endophytica]
MAYVTIGGEKYEKELIELATAHTTGRGEGKISKEEAADLLKSAQDGQGVTDIERSTLHYIRQHFEFTDAAASYFDGELAKL